MTVLADIRARNLLYEGGYWAIVADLRDGDHVDHGTYVQLLDRLHVGKFLDDIGYRRRLGRRGPVRDNADLVQQVAEPGTEYRVDTPLKKGQPDLFE